MREAFRLNFDSCYWCRSLGVGLVLQGSRVDFFYGSVSVLYGFRYRGLLGQTSVLRESMFKSRKYVREPQGRIQLCVPNA